MSRYEVRVTPPADEMISELDAWWRKNRSSAPDQILLEVDRVVDRLSENPGMGQLYDDPVVPAVRRMRLKKTPYHAYYWTDEEARVVWIMAVWSSSRETGPPLVRPR